MSSFIYNIYDKDGNEVDCKYKAYHVETGNWSDERTTDEQQVSFDNEDTDIDGNGVAFANGDHMMVYLYTDDAYGVFETISDGSDTYTGDRQVKPIGVPKCPFTLISDGTTGVEVAVTSLAVDEAKWAYDNTTHYHRATWYGQVLMNDELGIDTDQFKYVDDWVEDTTHTYDSADEYTVEHKVVNKKGNESICSDTIRIHWAQPTVTITHDPSNPKSGEEVTFTINTNDPDSRVTDQYYKVDGESTTEVKHTFTAIGSHIFEVITQWNDGFEDKEFTVSDSITIHNIAPTVDIVCQELGNGIYNVISNATDSENRMGRVEFKIEIDRNDVVSTTSGFVELDTLAVTGSPFNARVVCLKNGTYRLSCTAYDKDGGVSQTDYCVAEVTGIGEDCNVQTEAQLVYYDPLYKIEKMKKWNCAIRKIPELSFSTAGKSYNASNKNSSYNTVTNELTFNYDTKRE